jgi:hypothetical protein
MRQTQIAQVFVVILQLDSRELTASRETAGVGITKAWEELLRQISSGSHIRSWVGRTLQTGKVESRQKSWGADDQRGSQSSCAIATHMEISKLR